MRFIDLFCGIGGFRLVLEKRGLNCVFSSDFDPYVAESYKLNFGESPLSDITQISENKIPDHEILCAGFPCQPFSMGGLRKGFEDTRGTLFFDILRIIDKKKPEIIILENVKGLLSHDNKRTFKVMLNKLASKINGIDAGNSNNLGYNIFYVVLNARDFGLPQNRERVFIVGFKDQDVCLDLKYQPDNTGKLTSILDKNPEIKRISKIGKNNIITNLEKHRCYNQIKNLEYLVAYEIRKSRTSFRFDNCSPCLTTKMGTGGNNVPYLVNHDRFFTVKECLKLQGFDEKFQLTPSRSHAYRQLGNTISLPVFNFLASRVLDAFKV